MVVLAFRFRSFVALSLGLLSAACSEPWYDDTHDEAESGVTPSPLGTDAGLRDTSVAAIVDAPAADAMAAKAGSAFQPGQYAVLARFYGTADIAGWFAEESIAFAEVQAVPGADQLRMRWKVCMYRGRIVVPLFDAIAYAVAAPELLPERNFSVRLRGDSFEATAEAALVGYESVTHCPSGSSRSHPERPWLPNAQCTCPTNADLPPTLAHDCRVIDSDNDGQPGFSTQFSGGSQNASYSRAREGSQMVNGKTSPDGRHTAQFLSNMDTYQLVCAREPCTRLPTRVCPAAWNPVRFLPLMQRSNWDCSDVVAAVEASGLIGLGPPSPPDC